MSSRFFFLKNISIIPRKKHALRHIFCYTTYINIQSMYNNLLAQLPSLGEQFARAFDLVLFFFTLSPYWLPPLLMVFFWYKWLHYVRSQFIEKQEMVLLEIRLPQEVYKSPVAMQAVFDGLWIKGGESNFIDRLWFGKVRMWYSFELVSFEGQVHLYVWARKFFQRMVERSFYAHYPDIELVPVQDYALAFPFSLETHNCYGADFGLNDTIGVPIKTYVDYKLDQTASKEEQKVDPMAHVFEFLGSMGKGEYVWLQILARASKKEDMTFGFIRNRKTYEQFSKEEIARIRSSPEEVIVFPNGTEGKTLSDKQVKRVQLMNRIGLSSTHWDFGVRGIYIAEKEKFDDANITGLLGLWQPFGSSGYNSLTVIGDRWQPRFSYPWHDFNGRKEVVDKVTIIDAYRRRSWFHPPYEFYNYMITSEELATLFHIPGSVAKTPTLQRISSSRGEAPSNLPK